MIRNIIFDLAGVLLNLNLERDTEALLSVGLPDFEGCIASREIHGPISRYLYGLSDKAEFLKAIRPFCFPEATDEEILASMDAVLDDIPSSRLAALVELRKHYKVYLLSNLYDTAWDLTQQLIRNEGYTIEQCFDEAFISYKMHVAKPNPLIYQKVFEATGIQPEETMYFDDSRDNIEAARKLGIVSCLVPMNEIETCKEYQQLIETCSR